MFRSVSKHLVIGTNNFYFFSAFSRYIFNQVILTFRRVSLKTISYRDNLFFFFLLLQQIYFYSSIFHVQKCVKTPSHQDE